MIAVDTTSFVGRGIPAPVPADFDERFVTNGRLECEAYYRAPRLLVDAWLRARGKQRLIKERARHVRIKEDERKRLSRSDVREILNRAYPAMSDRRSVNPAVARRAAHYLQVVRNGGFIVSPTNDGDWRVGTRRVSPAQLVDMAKAKGFQA